MLGWITALRHKMEKGQILEKFLFADAVSDFYDAVGNRTVR